MNLSGLTFWRRPPIADASALATFVDEQSAFLVQKGIYEYSRARAGHYAKVLFHEREFHEAVDRARWQAYPLGLAMVGEVVEGVLRPHAGSAAARLADGVRALVLGVFDNYPVPASLDGAAWREERVALEQRLQHLALHAPKRVIDVPEPYARTYWNLMPIAKEIRSKDFPTTHSYLKVNLCNIHQELTNRADLAVLAAKLVELGADAPRAPAEESASE